MPEEIQKDLQEEITLEGMVIQRIHRGLYTAQSTTHANVKYDVDLLDLGGLGSCTCPDFAQRRYHRWRGVKKPYDIFRCRHLKRVRNHVLDQALHPHIKPIEDHH
jgi:hypothetical protein